MTFFVGIKNCTMMTSPLAVLGLSKPATTVTPEGLGVKERRLAMRAWTAASRAHSAERTEENTKPMWTVTPSKFQISTHLQLRPSMPYTRYQQRCRLREMSICGTFCSSMSGIMAVHRPRRPPARWK